MLADRNLLFGILALQMDFISRDALIAAMHAWVLVKTKPLGQILKEQGVLGEEENALLEALVEKHLKRHGNDPEKSLAALSSVVSVASELRQIGDPELQASLANVSVARPDGDSLATRVVSLGTPTSSGQRFRILRPHRKGGLGEVFVAHDEELHREVALKEIQDQFADQPESRNRFLLEAEVTGGLEHPGIVPVYGLGKYADGRPFYAMRFVKGDSLKDAIERFHQAEKAGRNASERILDLRKLLGRFLDVCNAVAYAHSRGVLHRDLKPGNIMLGPYGETLVVDWGLAKSVGRPEGYLESGERTLRPASASGSTFTQMGSAVGTPAYMSPEQAAGRINELGPASDVYSLGATLYCLLTGRAPIQSADLGVTLEKVRKGDFLAPRQVSKVISPALEAICLKAMALKPEDRYTSPRALAEDIESWLADEPVTAWREPWTIRSRRWLRRHRPLVTGTAALLLAAVPLALVLAFNREQARQQAETDKQEIAKQKDAALQREAETKAVLDFVENKIFAAARPEGEEGGLGHAVTLRRAIEAALPYVAKSFTKQPLIEARLRLTLGASFSYLGDAKIAAEQFVTSRELYARYEGPDHPDTLRSMMWLAKSYVDLGRYSDSLKLNEETLALMKAKLGLDHPDTLQSMNNLAESYYHLQRHTEAVKLLEQTLALREAKLGPGHPDTLQTMNDLATNYTYDGRGADGLKLFKETLALRKGKLGPEHPDTLQSTLNLAWCYRALGRHIEALKLREETLPRLKAKLGPYHPDTLLAMFNLAYSYAAVGRHADALKLREETLTLRKAKLGPDHPDTLMTMSFLASSYAAVGRHGDTLKLLEDLLELQKMKFGPDHPNTLDSMGDLANSYAFLGRLKEAEQIYKDLERHYQKAIERDPSDHRNWFCIAPLRLQRGDIEGYCRVCREMLARFSQTDKPEIDERTAKTCLLRPGGVSDLGPVRQLADRAVTGTEKHADYHWFLLAQGMADYRAGDFLSAIVRLNKSLSTTNFGPVRQLADRAVTGAESLAAADSAAQPGPPAQAGMAHLFLAMAHHQLGHAIEAQKALDQATKLTDLINAGGDWADLLRFRLVYLEAEELVREK